jgi:hypothetical protein
VRAEGCGRGQWQEGWEALTQNCQGHDDADGAGAVGLSAGCCRPAKSRTWRNTKGSQSSIWGPLLLGEIDVLEHGLPLAYSEQNLHPTRGISWNAFNDQLVGACRQIRELKYAVALDDDRHLVKGIV